MARSLGTKKENMALGGTLCAILLAENMKSLNIKKGKSPKTLFVFSSNWYSVEEYNKSNCKNQFPIIVCPKNSFQLCTLLCLTRPGTNKLYPFIQISLSCGVMKQVFFICSPDWSQTWVPPAQPSPCWDHRLVPPLLEHSHSHNLLIVWNWFCTQATELNSSDRD